MCLSALRSIPGRHPFDRMWVSDTSFMSSPASAHPSIPDRLLLTLPSWFRLPAHFTAFHAGRHPLHSLWVSHTSFMCLSTHPLSSLLLSLWVSGTSFVALCSLHCIPSPSSAQWVSPRFFATWFVHHDSRYYPSSSSSSQLVIF